LSDENGMKLRSTIEKRLCYLRARRVNMTQPEEKEEWKLLEARIDVLEWVLKPDEPHRNMTGHPTCPLCEHASTKTSDSTMSSPTA